MKKVCCRCGRDNSTTRIILSHDKYYCKTCYRKRNRVIHPLPPAGEIVLDLDGNPICHICGEAHKKLMSHVNQVHKINALEYKTKFGLDKYNGIMCAKSTDLARRRAIEHMDINRSNLENGAKYRFKKGYEGRIFSKVSLQTLNRLKKSEFVKNKEEE